MDLPIRLKSKECMAQLSSSEHSSTTSEKRNVTPPAPPTACASEDFSPYNLAAAPKIPSGLPPEIWTIVQSAPANFQPEFFLDVCRNLLENPNLTASHLARAELSYQSFTDATYDPKATAPDDLASIVKHLRPECRPRLLEGGVDGFHLEWTVVRKLIPRNPKLDAPMMQTCHLYTSTASITITTPSGHEVMLPAQRHLLVYIPHATTPDSIPFYHPTVRALAILYTYLSTPSLPSTLPSRGTLSIHYSPFPTFPIDTRLTRTALMLLQIIHKHSRGRQNGYKKRVHHDQVIPQKRFQDTYAYLKGKYAKSMIERWVEQTPAEKHVFEDLGIAAFLIEVWADMYGGGAHEGEEKFTAAKQTFPGFVDIGCGNGLLVYILNAEGWDGWGFDARRRKTWDSLFPPSFNAAQKLQQRLLVPAILSPTFTTTEAPHPRPHTGIFPPRTFIVSNHADQLTPWTPLLAALSSSPFIAIPCCSHDFTGARARAPVHRAYVSADPNAHKTKHKQPSAFAGLCSWVSYLSDAMGYAVEREYLRIPSTRNVAILGRGMKGGVGETEGGERFEGRLEGARRLVEREMKAMGGAATIEQVRRMWLESGGELVKARNGGH